MNLQGKLSGLKGLVTQSHGKRRFKGDLTLEMISPPLGDFRHTMHVGRGGDVFGDTSFLSNHGGPANGDGDTNSTSASTPDNKIGAFFSRTLRHVRKSSDNRPRGGSKDLSPPPPAVSPIIKNAVSLPRLDGDSPNGTSVAKELFPGSPNSPEESKCSYGLESGFVTLPRLSRSERQQPSISVGASRLPDATDAISPAHPATATTAAHSDSLPSLTSLDTFTLDLGPSLMSEVFGLLESPDGRSEGPGQAWEGDEAGWACGLTSEGDEMDSATISYVDSLLREDCGSRKSPYGGEWEEEEVEEERLAAEVDGGQGPLPSPGRERAPARMESDRFQNAADVLARHYQVGGLSKEHDQPDIADSWAMIAGQRRAETCYGYVDEEEEITV